MPLIRKRRAQAETSASPPAVRRRPSPPASDASSVDEAYDDEAAADGDTQGAGSNYDQMVKKLVRLALASEYSRQPIRRADITAKGTLDLSQQQTNFTQYQERKLKLLFCSHGTQYRTAIQDRVWGGESPAPLNLRL
ncbi:MAG: hypothetical protein LQ352_004095 [Teloschistes flavicans]|nr:MAG: hypothetical protein LQ352_004095 [Teloschistes flavicans]